MPGVQRGGTSKSKVQSDRVLQKSASGHRRWKRFFAALPVVVVIFLIMGMVIVRLTTPPEQPAEKPAVGEVQITVNSPPEDTSEPGVTVITDRET